MSDPIPKTLTGVPSVLPLTQAELDRVELRRLAARVGDLERSVKALEELISDAGVDRLMRQFRRLRKYLGAWLQED